MSELTKKRQLTPRDFKDTPLIAPYVEMCGNILNKERDYIVIDAGNLKQFIDSIEPESNGTYKFDHVFFNQVDLKEAFGTGLIFDGCSLFDCVVPDNCAYAGCNSYGTNIGRQSGLFHCYLEALSGGRLRVGANSYIEDSSLQVGCILGRNSVYYSKFGAQSTMAHYETGVTVYGGYHFENTYDDGVNVYAHISDLHSKDIDRFLKASNKNGIFNDYIGEDVAVYAYEYDFFMAPYGQLPFIEYPDKIYSLSQLVNKSPSSRNAFLNVLGGFNGKHEEHSTLTNKLFDTFDLDKAPYKNDRQIKSLRIAAFFSSGAMIKRMASAFLSSVYSKAGYRGDCEAVINQGAVNEMVKAVGDRCFGNYNNTKTLERVNAYTKRAGVQVTESSWDVFVNKSDLMITRYSGYQGPKQRAGTKQELQNV